MDQILSLPLFSSPLLRGGGRDPSSSPAPPKGGGGGRPHQPPILKERVERGPRVRGGPLEKRQRSMCPHHNRAPMSTLTKSRIRARVVLLKLNQTHTAPTYAP